MKIKSLNHKKIPKSGGADKIFGPPFDREKPVKCSCYRFPLNHLPTLLCAISTSFRGSCDHHPLTIIYHRRRSDLMLHPGRGARLPSPQRIPTDPQSRLVSPLDCKKKSTNSSGVTFVLKMSKISWAWTMREKYVAQLAGPVSTQRGAGQGSG